MSWHCKNPNYRPEFEVNATKKPIYISVVGLWTKPRNFGRSGFARDAYITRIGRADFFQIYLAGGQHAETACMQKKKKKPSSAYARTCVCLFIKS